MRRWKAGDRVVINGLAYEVVTGRKGDGDLVLTLQGQAIDMQHAALMLDFFWENEYHLQASGQRPKWKDPAEKRLLDLLKSAMTHGYKTAHVLWVKSYQVAKGKVRDTLWD